MWHIRETANKNVIIQKGEIVEVAYNVNKKIPVRQTPSNPASSLSNDKPIGASATSSEVDLKVNGNVLVPLNRPNDFIKDRCILKVQYIDEIHKRKLLNRLKQCKFDFSNTRIVFVSGPKLKDLLIHSKLVPSKCNAQQTLCYVCKLNGNSDSCMKKNVVYLLECSICNKAYIGETGRLFRVRMREHFRSVTECNGDNAMGSHYLDEHRIEHIPDFPFKCKILKRCRDYVDRRLWQSIEIKHRQPYINFQLMRTENYDKPWGF